MKTKTFITAILALIIIAFSFTNAEAHRGHRGGFCRPARVVVVPIMRPRVVCPPRYYAPVQRIRVYHRHWAHRRHC